jgi:hypothetical protein
MIASLKILFQTRKAFDYLDEQYESDLETNCTLIFGLLGGINGLNSFFKEKSYFIEHSDERFLIAFMIAGIAFGAVFGVLIGKYLTTYILYGLGKLLKGAGEVIDIRVVAAYSLIPGVLRLPFVIYFGINANEITDPQIFWIVDSISALIWFWTIKIMIQGIMRFNDFGFIKSLINISPIILIGLFWILLKLIF